MTSRILVVDDDRLFLHLITSMLRRRGYEVVTALDGQAALDLIRAQALDLIITDINMPKMDGWNLVNLLRSDPTHALIPIIFLTVRGGTEDRIHGFQLGADDYLDKDVLIEELEARIGSALRRRKILEESLRISAARNVKRKTGLKGSLAEVGLASLLSLLELEYKSGWLLIRNSSGNECAHLGLKDGRLITARMEDDSSIRNEEVIYRVLTWLGGEFEFNQDLIEVQPEIVLSNMAILLEGAKRLDENRK